MRRGPHQLEDDREDQSTYFIRCNAGKESIALDLTRAEARAVVLDLARASDVVVENFAPGVAARLGADYETPVRGEAGPGLLLDLGLRPDGPLAAPPRLRAHHQRGLRHDAPRARLGSGAAGGEPAGRRRARRHARLRRDPGRALAPHADGRGRAPRRLDARMPRRSRRRDLRQRAERRRGVRRAAAGHDRARDRRAVRGAPDGGRCGHLAPPRPRHGAARADAGRALFHTARPSRQLAGDERRHHRLARRLRFRRRGARRR